MNSYLDQELSDVSNTYLVKVYRDIKEIVGTFDSFSILQIILPGVINSSIVVQRGTLKNLYYLSDDEVYLNMQRLINNLSKKQVEIFKKYNQEIPVRIVTRINFDGSLNIKYDYSDYVLEDFDDEYEKFFKSMENHTS